MCIAAVCLIGLARLCLSEERTKVWILWVRHKLCSHLVALASNHEIGGLWIANMNLPCNTGANSSQFTDLFRIVPPSLVVESWCNSQQASTTSGHRTSMAWTGVCRYSGRYVRISHRLTSLYSGVVFCLRYLVTSIRTCVPVAVQ